MPREKRDRIERLDELYRFLDQSNISRKNLARLRILSSHQDGDVAERAGVILEIARVLPGKPSRWLKLARRHPPLFGRAVALFGVQFFEDSLAGTGDLESPLWNILEPDGEETPGADEESQPLDF